MKDRNGFTLVELLAVIAILAILVIIALPNVINMYNRAQKQTFLTEAKKVYSESEKKYLTNAISGKKTKIINSEDSSRLDMTGKKLQYCVILNNSGKVTDMKVSNGKWVASLNGKAIEDLTIDDLEDGNLDDYECVKVTDESCFTYETINDLSGYGTPVITIEDSNKCKTYLTSDSVGAPEDAATKLCNGESYDDNDEKITIQTLVINNYIESTEYDDAGLKIDYIMVDNVNILDSNKCKNYLQQNFPSLTDEMLTKVCVTREGYKGEKIDHAVLIGTIPYSDYEKAGLKVTSVPLTEGVSITDYNTSCGSDVTIPSKLNGKYVVKIDDFAFSPDSCYRRESIDKFDNDYKIKFLNYNADDEFMIKKIEATCESEMLTSVVIPNTISYIGEYAFADNKFTEITIPYSIKTIKNNALRSDYLLTIYNNSLFPNEKDIWIEIVGICTSFKFNDNIISIIDRGCK